MDKAALLALADRVEALTVLYDPNYAYFGLLGKPFPRAQHPNQQRGLDIYVHVINFETGERCLKKLYENKRGLHFKHSGYSPMYLDDFTTQGTVIPFQVCLQPRVVLRATAGGEDA